MSGQLIGPIGVLPSAVGSPPVLDGTPVQTNYSASTSAPTVVAPTTTGTSDIICVAIYYNLGAPAVSGVSGGGLTWVQRGATISSGSNSLEFWYATTTSPIAAPTITATFSTPTTFGTLVSFAFSGVNTSSPFDSGAPSTTNTTTAPTITTTNANTVIFGMFVCASSTGNVQATFSALGTTPNSNFVVDEYKQFTSAQSSLSVGITSDTIVVGIVDAVKP